MLKFVISNIIINIDIIFAAETIKYNILCLMILKIML